jgi:dimethylargininase
MSRFTQALIRPPAANFADGLTTVDLGTPDFALTLNQHAAYCAALVGLGVALCPLPANAEFPDSTFVEDTAILTARGAILCRPGAASRAGEGALVRAPLAAAFERLAEIAAPGTLDGGDVCEAGDHFFIGLSERTNEAGAEQLTAWLAARGYSASTIDIRGMRNILHFKSGASWLGDQRLVVIESLLPRGDWRGFEIVTPHPADDYAANLVRVNDGVLFPAGYPRFAGQLRMHGYQLVELDMSEFRKMDGGLSCLSLRW